LAFSKSGVFWRANTGASVYESKGKKRFVRFGVAGQADITGLLKNGRRVEIEVKKKGGKQTEKQQAFQETIESNDGLYVLAYGVNDVIERGL
jgi:photosystem II stability/assembly factor-like uncharacterized protein|tara:strand:+ start:1779 stop:2054 length:276 start_codon:yes stop_codon:yes gene_type:complete